MKVCLDIQAALAQRAGVGRYTRMLAEHLALQAGQDEITLFYFDFKRRGCDFAPPGARQRAVRWIPGRVVQKAWKTVHAPPFDWFSGPADLFHFPNFIRPPLRRGRSVVTIHDASFLRHPETLEEKNYRYLMRCIHRTVEKADAIICVAQFTADELQELMGVPPDRLHAVPSGLSRDHRRAPAEDIADMRRRLNLTRPYLLSVGTLEPRKHFGFLIDVFEQLPYDGDLVIAGMKGWKCEDLLRKHEASPRRDRIRFLHYVDERDMAALYSGADLYVTPSLYEGFGFTPLEAMQCGTPVVSSTGGSLPEVLGDAARLVPGFKLDAWKDAVAGLLEDASARQQLVARGHARAAAYTWEETARRTWEVYRKVAG